MEIILSESKLHELNTIIFFSYVKMYETLQTESNKIGVTINPDCVFIDFEKAAHKATGPAVYHTGL